MIRRVVRLPNGRQVGLGEYVRSWKIIRKTPGDTEIRGWEWYPLKAANILRELRHGMHDRINRHIPGFGKGRRWSPDWQRQTANLAREVNTPRLVVRWIPIEYRQRLMHRIFED